MAPCSELHEQLRPLGGDLRHVLLPASIWGELLALQGDGGVPDSPVFRSRKGGHLTARQAQRLVDAAARRAGLCMGV